ncbi:MAG: lipase family protein [Planctomycetota bacterium]|jgi:hypothetical protein
MACAKFEPRQKMLKLMKEAGMEEYLQAPVSIERDESGILLISDNGLFAIQHDLVTPTVAADPNIVIGAGIMPNAAPKRLCVVTHGWLEKGRNRWPCRMAASIHQVVDSDDWLCAAFDWKGGSVVVTAVHAAKYARDIGGPRLAAAAIATGVQYEHIHLIGHSAGSWVINSAARQLAAAYPNATFHLTFLDAYVPEWWEQAELGLVFVDDPVRQKAQVWAEHYFVKDLTWKVTEHELSNAHNVDITAADPLVKEHEFPYRWYQATAAGKFERWDEKKEKVYTNGSGTEYGYTRSRQKGEANYKKSTQLKKGNKAVKIKKK